MSKIISGTNISLTDSLKDHIFKHIQKIEQFDSKITNIRFFLKKDAHEYIAEIKVNSGIYKDDIVTVSATNDMYESINTASKKMITRLKKLNERVKINHHKAAA